MKVTGFARRSLGLFGLALAVSASQTALAAVIEGRVTEASGTVGIEGATVTIDGTTLSTTTDRSGRYRFGNAPAGDLNLTVEYFGADAVSGAVSVIDDGAATLDFSIGADVRVMENVLVTGQRGAFLSSINRQRTSDTTISVLSADVIGSLPDQNVAESARRIPGLSIQNDQGEGRFITIRGLDPSLNAVSVNGVRLPSPEGDTRAVAVDVIDSDVLNAITVQKSLTPDLDGDGIGGSINIETLSAFDRDGRFLRIKAEGIYSEISENWGEKIGITASDTFLDGRLGVAGNITFNRRDFGSDNTEVDGEYVVADALSFYPEELEFRDYQIERERTSATLNFDYRLNTSTDLYLRTLYNEFSDQEFRSRVEIKLDDADFLGITNEDGRRVANFGEGDEIEFDRDIKDRLEEQQIWSIQTGGETNTGALTWTYGLAYSQSEEGEPNRIDAAFRADDVDDATANALFGLDVTDPRRPTVFTLDPTTTGYFFDGDNFEFDDLEFLNGITEDQEWAAFIDLKREGNVFGVPGFVKGGAKARIRTKSRDVDLLVFDGYDGPDLILSDFAQPVDFGLANIGPVPNAGLVRNFFNQNRDDFELNGVDTAVGSNADDYEVDENVYAAYLMAQMNFDSGLRLTGGVRLEATNYSATATGTSLEAGAFSDATVVNGVPVGAFAQTIFSDIDDDNDNGIFDDGDEYEIVSIGAVSDSNTYLDVLPSIIARYDVNETTVFRASYYRSLARPNFSAVVPRALVEIDEGDIQGEVGNPDLDRQIADNFELGLEFYPGSDTAITVSVFRKSIEDFIAQQTFFDTNIRGIDYDEVVTSVNLGSAEVNGFEVSYQNVFSDLPAPFDGFLTIASWTHQNGSSSVDGRDIPLPTLSDDVFSFILGYDKGPLDLRAAVSYQSAYLDEIGTGGEGVDRYEDDYLRVDLTAKFEINENFEISAELQNATDAPADYFYQQGNARLLSQFEEYGYTARFGVRFTY